MSISQPGRKTGPGLVLESRSFTLHSGHQNEDGLRGKGGRRHELELQQRPRSHRTLRQCGEKREELPLQCDPVCGAVRASGHSYDRPYLFSLSLNGFLVFFFFFLTLLLS